VHELATNAAKYGSLSVELGKVDVSWSAFEGILTLIWRETGGPPVSAPRKPGFGTKIISSLGGSHRGRTNFQWLPDGLTFTLELRYQHQAPAHTVLPARDKPGAARLLLVEDELVVGMFMQELLESIGYRSTEPIGRLSDALAAAQRERFRGAVLDMNLNGEIVYPLAELLVAQQVPFVFVTGYAPRSVDPRFTTVPILQKPVLQDDLASTLERVLAGPQVRAQPASGAAAE
jgi:CheY-like chemotaxis protein